MLIKTRHFSGSTKLGFQHVSPQDLVHNYPSSNMFIFNLNEKQGLLSLSKIEMVMQKTEDVVEAVEKAAEKVEKVAEDILDDLPKGGKLRETIDFVEKLAERTRMDVGAVDDFIEKVQDEEEKAQSLQKDEPKSRPDETKN